MTGCNCNNTLTNSFETVDKCSWVVLLVGAYFFLAYGCMDNIFGNSENSIVWIILLFYFLFVYNQRGGSFSS